MNMTNITRHPAKETDLERTFEVFITQSTTCMRPIMLQDSRGMEEETA